MYQVCDILSVGQFWLKMWINRFLIGVRDKQSWLGLDTFCGRFLEYLVSSWKIVSENFIISLPT